VLDEMRPTTATVAKATRFDLAVKVYQHTAAYDGAISNWLGKRLGEKEAHFPPPSPCSTARRRMRYGENPHQGPPSTWSARCEASIATARQLQGKELSYNNIADTDAALECVKQFTRGRPA
jgi:phosphoribosylaminoimidazolecarboxamide formyltransferase / IMP cyclohydrolase